MSFYLVVSKIQDSSLLLGNARVVRERGKQGQEAAKRRLDDHLRGSKGREGPLVPCLPFWALAQ